MHLMPPPDDLLSRNIPQFVPPDVGSGALVLHLGCGDVPSADARVLSIDVLPTSAADLVAEAEALPFAAESVDYVVSGATFEHVPDPVTAGREVRRVLKPGARFYIDTALLQGYHGFPSHFFNMTAQAVETYLVDDLELIYSSGSPSGGPVVALSDLLRRILNEVGQETASGLLRLSVEELLEALDAEKVGDGPISARMSEHTRRSLAAAVVAIAEKPLDHRPFDDAVSKRAYYAARAGIIQFHHEAIFHGGACGDPDHAPPDLTATLAAAARAPWPERVRLAQKAEARMRVLRDYWKGVAEGLTPPPA